MNLAPGETARGRFARFLRRSKFHAAELRRPRTAWRMTGPLPNSGPTVTVVAIGPPGFERQVEHVFLGRCEHRERVEGRNMGLRDGATMVVRARRPCERPRARELTMPLALDARIVVGASTAQHVATLVAETHRKALEQRTGIDYRVVKGSTHLRFWHQSLYVPLLQLRHGERAEIEPLASFERRSERLELLFAIMGGEIVGGSVLEHDPWSDTLTRSAGGALPSVASNAKLYKVVSVAIEHRALERAHERKMGQYSLGFTLPRIDSGLFAYKRRWGAAFHPFTWSHCAFVAVDPHRKAEVLAHAPIVTQSRQGAIAQLGAADADERSIAALAEHIEQSSFSNCQGLVVHAASAARVRAVVAERAPGAVVETASDES